MLKALLNKNVPISYSKNTIDILCLIRTQNVGPRTFYNLIKLFGSAEIALENIGEFSLKGGRATPIKPYSVQEVEKELDILNENKAFILTYQDHLYPELLTQITDCPPVITYMGNISLFDSDMIAIVGARNSSINSKTFAKNVAIELISAGYTTVSGLARGIDTAVHKANTSQTMAVLAGEINHIYPPENEKLYKQIANDGLIIAELPIGSKPLSRHFPQRNRIISGLSIATVVIEAGLKSGSLITTNCALEQGRDVFTAPGFPMDPRCMGSNQLIKDGAYLLESAKDIIMNISSIKKIKKSLEDSQNYSKTFKSFNYRDNMNITESDRKVVTSLLSASPISFEAVASETNFSLPMIYTIFLELELAGRVIRHPGNKISLIY